MKTTLLNSILALSVVAPLAMPVSLAAQASPAREGAVCYRVIDLGTLCGGTFSQQVSRVWEA